MNVNKDLVIYNYNKAPITKCLCAKMTRGGVFMIDYNIDLEYYIIKHIYKQKETILRKYLRILTPTP